MPGPVAVPVIGIEPELLAGLWLELESASVAGRGLAAGVAVV